MTDFDGAWGAPPSARYESIAARFRPAFERIREGAVERERNRRLPFDEVGWLRGAGLTSVRVPEDRGGLGVTLPEFFALLTELAAADSNLPQILRVHFHFVEDVVTSGRHTRRDVWLDRLHRGDIVGGAWTEGADSKLGTFSTALTPRGDALLLTGTKLYSTGSLFADWIDVGAVDEKGETISAVVSARAPGVDLVDDWDGFGQILTGSGTTVFKNAPVDRQDVWKGEQRIGYSPAFYQTVHLATLSGIARSAARDVARAVHARRRNFTHAAAAVSKDDPQVLQVVGKVFSRAYAANAIVLKAAEAVQRAHEFENVADAAAKEAANVAAEIETAQAQTVVAQLVLDAVTVLFDALGASAVGRDKSLDRYWRNARTLASHNPLIYKERVVGAWAVSRTPPPFQWNIGNVPTPATEQSAEEIALAAG